MTAKLSNATHYTFISNRVMLSIKSNYTLYVMWNTSAVKEALNIVSMTVTTETRPCDLSERNNKLKNGINMSLAKCLYGV